MKKIILPLLFITLFICGCTKIETPNQNLSEKPEVECLTNTDCPLGHECQCHIATPADCPQCEGGDIVCMCIDLNKDCGAIVGQVMANVDPNDPRKSRGCCPGLILKPPKKAYADDCHMGEGFGVLCLACGDGVCDSTYESNCNCPEDCE